MVTGSELNLKTSFLFLNTLIFFFSGMDLSMEKVSACTVTAISTLAPSPLMNRMEVKRSYITASDFLMISEGVYCI